MRSQPSKGGTHTKNEGLICSKGNGEERNECRGETFVRNRT